MSLKEPENTVLANSDDSSSDYVYDPKNPNRRVRKSKSNDGGRTGEDDGKSTVVEKTPKKAKTKSILSSSKKTKITTEKEKEEQEEDEQQEESVVQFEQYLMVRLERALRQFYAVIDKIRAVSGKKIYYRYSTELDERQRKIPIVWGCRTLDEFFAENERILGRDFLLRLFIESRIQKFPVAKVKFQAIGVEYTVDEIARLERIFKKSGDDLLYISDNHWLKYVLDNPAFEFIMDSVSGVFGALEMAAREIGYPLKDLIYSDDVNFFFAQYVARKFVSPNQNVQADRTDGSTVQYRIHGGFYTNQQDTKWLLGFKELVKKFYYVEDTDIRDFFGNNLNDLKTRKDELIEILNNEKTRKGENPFSENEILAYSKLNNVDQKLLDAAEAIRLYKRTEAAYKKEQFFARVLKIKKGSY